MGNGNFRPGAITGFIVKENWSEVEHKMVYFDLADEELGDADQAFEDFKMVCLEELPDFIECLEHISDGVYCFAAADHGNIKACFANNGDDVVVLFLAEAVDDAKFEYPAVPEALDTDEVEQFAYKQETARRLFFMRAYAKAFFEKMADQHSWPMTVREDAWTSVPYRKT
jgi:hypothetical protein